MSGDARLNPYAAPQAQLEQATGAEHEHIKRDAQSLAAAIEALNGHLAQPDQVASDAWHEEGFVPRRQAIILAVVLVACLAALVPGLMVDDLLVLAVLGGIGLACGTIALVVIAVVSLTVGPRHRATDPRWACRQHYKAMSLGRPGTVMVGLSPFARHQTVRPPRIAPVKTSSGLFRLNRPKNIRKYLQSFARSGHAQVRWTRLVRVLDVQAFAGMPEVAICRVKLRFRSWPQWANILGLVFFFANFVIGSLLAALLYFILRKTRTLVAEKTLIRGQNGLWYAYCAEPIESIVNEER